MRKYSSIYCLSYDGYCGIFINGTEVLSHIMDELARARKGCQFLEVMED